MKTERQWQRLWEYYCKQYKGKHPQSRDFLAARRLLLEYTGHENRHHLSEWPYYFTYLTRFFKGSWNRHHGLEVTTVLEEHGSEPEQFQQLLSTTDNFNHLPLEKMGEKSEINKSPYRRKWLTIGTHSQGSLTSEDFKQFGDAILNNKVENDVVTLEDGRKFQLNPVGFKGGSWLTYNEICWRTQVQGLVRHEQAYELLDEIQEVLADKAINPHGDLAKILRVISKNTGYPIAIAHDYFMSFKHYGSMVKDLIDTFKPYKSDYYFYRDLKQPVEGFANLAKGVHSLVGVPFVFLRNLLSLVFFSRSHDGSWSSLGEDILDNLALSFTEPLSYLADGLYSLIHGATQIAATPLLLIKLPLRWLIGKGKPDEIVEDQIRNSETIKEMFSKLEKMQNKAEVNDYKAQIISEIHRKYQKNIKRGALSHYESESTLFKKAQFPQESLEVSSSDEAENAQDQYLSRFRA